MISQTAQFMGCNAHRLYDAYLSSAEHAAMTLDGTYAATFRRGSEDIANAAEGDELRAFGLSTASGETVYSLHAKVLQLIADRSIVLSWRNKAWDCAIDPGDISDFPSTVVLTFRDNFAGAEIRLDQVNLPDYKIKLPDTGEVGPLSEIVNTHWSLLYWEPMRHYFAR
jgi:hypothetical protein